MRSLFVSFTIIVLIGSQIPVESLSLSSLVRNEVNNVSKFLRDITNVIECDTCNALLPIVRLLVQNNQTQLINFVCTKLRIEDSTICKSIIDTYQYSIIKVAKYSPLNNKEICSAILNCAPITNPVFNWTISLPSIPKPPVKPPTPPKPNSPKIRILHLTDIHADLEYQPGAIANCDQPLCCRNSSSTKKEQVTTAGYWGDYRSCDVPIWTVEKMFEHIAANEEFDFVYMTGDIPPHNVWNQTKSDQLNSINVLTGLFLKYFPNKIIYSTLGNHEAAPCNLFPSKQDKEDNISWLYDALAENWVKTGLPTELKKNISTGAFYSIQITPGLRLISLNMNYCYNLNFWLLIDSVDPLGQLSWLIDTLQASENSGEKVHIIGHVDPMGCFESWSKSYYEIVNRYESTIVGQFFGHTHFDQFEMFYDLTNKTRAVGVAYIAGSITTFNHDNPNYRIYTVDGDYENSSWQVLDHDTYFMNLTEANLSLDPNWQKEYSAKEAFGLPSLYPQDWADLLDNMILDLNGTLVDRLYKFYSSSAEGQEQCDMKCRKNFVCTFKQARSDNFIHC